MRRLKTCWLICSFIIAGLVAQIAYADSDASDIKYAVPLTEAPGFVAKIELHTAEEIELVLRRAEAYLESTESYPDLDPIAVILHGPELQLFDRRNYSEYKEIVGLAARLDALNVINVQACEVQMVREGISINDLPHFVESIPYGPAEEKRLLKKGYQYF